MIDTGKIRGVLLDYGGTVDSNGVHWAEVIWQAYQSVQVSVTKEVFREAYVHGERTLGKNPIIKPDHTFLDMMQLKIEIQGSWFKVQGSKEKEESDLNEIPLVGKELSYRIADYCYNYARTSVEKARPVIEWIASRYPIVLVSNFYGNIRSVLRDFGIDHLFPVIIESAVVGVRKPDPQLFELGLKALQLNADEVVVIGDSYDKDIIPATTLGCQTIWLKNTGWNEYTGTEIADLVIADLAEITHRLS